MSSWWNNVLPGLKKVVQARMENTPAAQETKGRANSAAGGDDEPAQWIKCPGTNDLIHRDEIESAHWVTPAGFHMRIGPEPRFKSLFDDGKWEEIALPKVVQDPLKFRDEKRYVDKLTSERKKVGRDDCMAAAFGAIGEKPAVVLVQDFAFMGGSLGMAAGEAFITAAQSAVKRNAAFIVVTASGGARMQEGTFSLMQMPRTTLAIQEVREAGLPYIVILADPTSGGVTASYAMLGDIHISEPNAMIAFSGPRVIEQTIRQKLPEGLQRAEYLLDKGMLDMVVDRRQHREKLTQILSVLMRNVASTSLDQEPELPLPAPAPPQRAAEGRRNGAKQKQRAAE
jgi:acetyl-CoA carboxylase carboxyl transferase subunit beta